RQILNRLIHFPVTLDEIGHEVIDRLQTIGVVGWLPAGKDQYVMAGLGLRLGRDRQKNLAALRTDVVDRDFDLVLLAPFLPKSLGGIVAAGNPMVPEAN